MSGLVVDASVWVSAIDSNDPFHRSSDAFLAALMDGHENIIVPSIARLEVSCALATVYGNAVWARALSEEYLRPPFHKEVPVTEALLDAAITIGTEQRLRAADALYAAVAMSAGVPLVAWDKELITRAGAITPQQWLDDR